MRLLILFLFFIFAVNAMAASVLKSAALPMFHNGERAFAPHSALGPICSSLRALKNEPACNPALLGEDPVETLGTVSPLIPGNIFGVNVLFGHHLEKLSDNQELMAGNDKLALAQSFFSETEPVRFEASTLLWWRGQTMSLSIQPLRVTYFSDVRNQSLPDIALFGMQEQSVQGQLGGFLNENLRVGLQVRYLDRKFVFEEFNLFSAIPNIDQYFQVKKQRAIFLEPGLAYEFTETEELRDWRPLLTLNISQTGWLSQSYDEVPVSPLVDAGFSLMPPLMDGELELGLNYRYTTYVSLQRKFRFGAIYRLSSLQLQAGVDVDEWSLGFSGSFWGVGAGIVHKQIKVDDFNGEESLEKSTLLEARYAF